LSSCRFQPPFDGAKPLTCRTDRIRAAGAAGAVAQPTQNRAATVSQWASSASATTEYGSTSWAADQATGAPDVSACGDNGSAWASSSSTGYDKLKVSFDTPVVPTTVKIYLSYNPGQVSLVQVVDINGKSTVIYKKSPRRISQCPYVMTLPVKGVTAPVDAVRITVNQGRLKLGWTEVDAVQLVGKP
jgi:hypothetical protein